LFRRAYCQQAVCSPSRTSLLTGLRPDSTKVYDLVTHFRKTIPNVVTLPQRFKNEGYHVVGMGKIYHGSLDDPQSWSEPHRNGGGAAYVLPENQRIMAAAAAATKKGDKNAKKATARGAPVEMADVPDSAYHDGSLADMAVEKLRMFKQGKQPFFLAVGFLKPHLPFTSPKKYWDLYDPQKLKAADNPFAPKNSLPYTLTDFGELRAYEGVPKKGPVSEEMARQLVHGYRAATSFTDANIGRVLDALDQLDLRKNTIVVLWGDHGWKLGEHGSWCKHTNLENDTHTVLIVSAPGAKANGQACDRLVEFVDIYPTLCDLAGIPAPSRLEGTSMRPLLSDPAREWKSAAFSQYPRNYEGRALMGYAMATDRYRFVEWRDKNTGEALSHELYDHQTDPEENESLAASPQHQQLVKQLASQLKAGWPAAKPK
jgi:arylsulfatase A-like enzyme